MDPNEAYRQVLEWAEQVAAASNDAEADPPDMWDAEQAAEYFLALDGWIRSGGFLPRAWSPDQK